MAICKEGASFEELYLATLQVINQGLLKLGIVKSLEKEDLIDPKTGRHRYYPHGCCHHIGLDVHEPVGNMIVDIGGGTTEIAVIALSGIVYAQSVRLGGDELNDDIINYFRRNHNLLIGERTAEKIKCEIGSAAPLDEELEMITKGRDLVNGVPRTRQVTSKDVREAISESVNTIVESITKSLEQTPPELSADILDRGIMLTGGGALLKNLDKLIMETTDLPVHIAEDPLTAVVRGTGSILEDIEHYRTVVS